MYGPFFSSHNLGDVWRFSLRSVISIGTAQNGSLGTAILQRNPLVAQIQVIAARNEVPSSVNNAWLNGGEWHSANVVAKFTGACRCASEFGR